MFSQKMEYALRAVVQLAYEAPAAQTVEQIAAATGVRQAYLAKVVQELRRAGVVRSQRGVGGGVSLEKAPQALTLLEVINAVDPIKRITTCPLGLAAHGARLCRLHKRVDNALAMIEDAFRNTTLAELLTEPDSSVPLCSFPAARVTLK
jgi:Rrf2 family protein